MSNISGTVTSGVRWIIDANGVIIGYRNPISDKDEVWTLGAIVQGDDGRDYLTGPDGALIPITPAVGTYSEAEVLGVKQAVVTLDSGNDANAHNDWALTYDCTLAGQPGVADGPLAVERFVRADPNEIVITGLSGSIDAGIVYFPEFTTLSMVHVAQLGGTTYPDSASATCALNEKVRVDFPEGTIALEIQARSPTGANGRYRQIIFTPFLARGA